MKKLILLGVFLFSLTGCAPLASRHLGQSVVELESEAEEEEEEQEEIREIFEEEEQEEIRKIFEEEIYQIEALEEEAEPRQFFEDITLITDPDCYLVLVNKNNVLSSDYSPSDLVLPNILNHQFNSSIFMRVQAADMVEQLFQAAFDEAGLVLLARSGYRSYQTQAGVHQRFVNRYGQEAADWFSARPGHSEHQTGLAIDITADSVNRALVIGFGDTAEGQWLNQNAHRFGFILRYPLGRELDTGYQYEPWHFRYVGIDAATYIFENDLILEEYLGRW